MPRAVRDLIGVDEVGYGPRLGPFIVTGCRLRRGGGADVFEPLAGGLSRDAADWPRRLPVGDSKRLYASRRRRRFKFRWPADDPWMTPAGATYPSADFQRLEALAMALLAARETPPPATLADLLRRLSPDPRDRWVPAWCPADALPLPLSEGLPWATIERAAALLRHSATTLVGLSAVVMHAPRFNRAVEALGSKATLDVHAMIRVARRLVRSDDHPTEAWCGKVGGTRRYLPHMPPGAARRECHRSPRRSTYEVRISPESSSTFVLHFLQDVEDACLPAALAALLGKYLRELFMVAFNAWIAGESRRRGTSPPAPSAGYPRDAERLRQELRRTWGEDALAPLWRQW